MYVFGVDNHLVAPQHTSTCTLCSTLYMDLHSRPHKYSSSVMYTLRCGRGKYPWEVEQQQQQQQQDGGYQHATVNLVCGMAMSLVRYSQAPGGW